MKKRLVSIGLCALMAVGLIAEAAPVSGVDLTKPGTLNVELSSKGFSEDLGSEGGETPGVDDSETAGVVYDLYKLADAEDLPGYDAYTFSFLEGYEALEDQFSDEIDNKGWEQLAQSAARIALNPGGTPAAATFTDLELNTNVENIGTGLYLVIARDRNMKPEEYIREIEDETGAKKLVTIAQSAEYEYTFQPELLALPTKDAETDEDGNVISPPNTANSGDWVFDVTMELKPERESRFGSLRIVKNLPIYEDTEPATFVFRITGVKDDETVYSNVAGLTFSSAGSEEVVLDRIPVGAQVTVEEVYSGASYTVSGDRIRSGEITLEDILEVTFENTYDREEKRGHGIINQFSYEVEDGGGWSWQRDPAGLPTE